MHLVWMVLLSEERYHIVVFICIQQGLLDVLLELYDLVNAENIIYNELT